MYWVEFEGLPMPLRIGGHPALDLCNTWAGWGGPPRPRSDWLQSYDHLAVWVQHAGLITPMSARRLRRAGRRSPSGSAQVLGDIRRLRTLVHSAVLDPRDKAAVAGVTGYVRRAGALVRVVAGNPPTWEISEAAGLSLPLLAAAWAAGDLLTAGPLDAVASCPGHDCGWLFIDTSGRRRWCSMSTCGNRAKVAAHARRNRATSGPLTGGALAGDG